MIVELAVQNLAIIERAQIALAPGFSAMTGETGAGKSLLIDAIELALGERADTELVRAGAPRATVHVAFDLSDRPELLKRCADLGFETEDGTLYISREVFAEGRSQARIGGRLAPISALRQLGRLLVDLHGQHSHQSLLDPSGHVGFLDAWVGEPAERLREEVAERYRQSEEARRRLAALQASLRDREQRIDLLRFQVEEIETAAPLPGELDEAAARLERLKHVERLVEASAGALGSIVEDEGCALDRIGQAVRDLESAARHDPKLETVAASIRDSLYTLQEAAHELRAYVDALEADPAALDVVADRIDALKRLRRKYGEDEAAILAHLEAVREELATLEDVEASEASLEATAERTRVELDRAAGELTDLRATRASEFAELVQAQLRDLAMDRAIFEVRLRPRAVDADGADEIEFLFSANAGEPPRPLAKIASGGEISRVMLAIKTALAGRAGVPTLIFDEVDAGMGGRAAATVAKKLQELGRHYQVLVISHLPQIASRASTHFRIEKAEANGRAATSVRVLERSERVEEIARMLAGEQITPTALANAAEMMGAD